MRLIKDRISLCIIALLIICLTIFTNSAISAELQNAPLNPEFIKYQEKLAIETALDLTVADDGSFLGEVPAPVDMSHIKSVYYPEMDAAPATYDLRSYGKLPSIKDQSTCGSCWTFAQWRRWNRVSLRQIHGIFQNRILIQPTDLILRHALAVTTICQTPTSPDGTDPHGKQMCPIRMAAPVVRGQINTWTKQPDQP